MYKRGAGAIGGNLNESEVIGIIGEQIIPLLINIDPW